jgi:CRP-like cAMP-binding protein
MPRSADAYTEGACELLILDRSDFLYCLERSPKLALAVIACLARRLREAADRQAEHQSLDVMGRLSTFLLNEMASGSTQERDGHRLHARITQQEIADRIATSRETVNRGLSRLRHVGAIRQSGRLIVITKPDKLKQYSQS